MERDKIIKALECCPEQEYCGDCPYDNECMGMEFLILDALSLIKELTEENERLKSEVSVKRKLLDKAEVRMDCLDEVNKVLKADICNATMNLEHITKENEKLKADTVRKMRDEINKTLSALCKGDVSEIRRMIDHITKEMLEEGK